MITTVPEKHYQYSSLHKSTEECDQGTLGDEIWTWKDGHQVFGWRRMEVETQDAAGWRMSNVWLKLHWKQQDIGELSQ